MPHTPMSPERWLKVKEIFNSAIQYGPDERQTFLAEACRGDSTLMSDVESLIASHEKSGKFIDEPAYQAAAQVLVTESDELQPGTIFGPYQIVSFISRGGMGEVYLAQDKRLSRKLALKLLPTALTRNDDRLRRFEQEARAASALNHPNIITIYAIDEVDSTHVIATEFVEGETLRHRLHRFPLSLTELLAVAIQIADALSAAHKAGIIHRDIKPENVMLRPDGYVKVLDFGLAKLSEEAGPSVAAEAPTLQVRTGGGIVMGTVGYMSPEQARGLAVDGRSDIFSLGAVIYEMVARRKPFDGDTASDTLASILRSEPPALSSLSQIPAELNRIVTKALQKDREERYQVVRDLLLDLKALKQELDFQAKFQGSQSGIDREKLSEREELNETRSLSAAQQTDDRGTINVITEAVSVEVRKHKLRTALLAGLAALVVVLVAFGLYRALKRPAPQNNFSNVKLERLTNSGNVIDATLSPDGKYLVYVLSDRSNQSLWIRQVSTANDKQIVSPAPVGYFGITFSRDGNELYYAVKSSLDTGSLYRCPVLGGTSVKILERIDGPVSFSPDGKRFALVRANFPNPGESSLVLANADGSGEQTLAVRKHPERFAPVFFTGPSWSPDGQLIAASVNTVAGMANVYSFAVKDGHEQPLLPGGLRFAARVEWLPDMSGLVVVGGDSVPSAQLWLVSYPSGEKRRITNDLNTYRALGLTADGKKLSTIQSNGLVNVWLLNGTDASHAVRLPTGNVGFYGAAGNSLSWTPDGLLVFVSNESGDADIWLTDRQGQNRKQLTTNTSLNYTPVVSSDGKYIFFVSTRSGSTNIWRMNIDGSNPVRLTTGLLDSHPSICVDGKWVFYTSATGVKPTAWKVSVDGAQTVQVSDHIASAASISPDGRSLAIAYPDSPDPYAPPNKVAIIPAETGDWSQSIPVLTIQLSGPVSTLLEWSHDGKSILYTVNSSNFSNIWSQALDGSPPKQITDFKDGLTTGFAWSRDGKTLACTRGVLMRDAVLVTDLTTENQ